MKHHTSQRDSPADILPDMYTSSPASFHAPTLTTKLTLSADDLKFCPFKGRNLEQHRNKKERSLDQFQQCHADFELTLMSISDTKSDSPLHLRGKASWRCGRTRSSRKRRGRLGGGHGKQTFPLQRFHKKQENANASWGGTSSRLHTIESDLPSQRLSASQRGTLA